MNKSRFSQRRKSNKQNTRKQSHHGKDTENNDTQKPRWDPDIECGLWFELDKQKFVVLDN